MLKRSIIIIVIEDKLKSMRVISSDMTFNLKCFVRKYYNVEFIKPLFACLEDWICNHFHTHVLSSHANSFNIFRFTKHKVHKANLIVISSDGHLKTLLCEALKCLLIICFKAVIQSTYQTAKVTWVHKQVFMS